MISTNKSDKLISLKYLYTAAKFQIYLSLLYRVCLFLGSMAFRLFSFVEFPSERRMCILPFSEALLHRLDGYKSPLFCLSVGMVLVVSVYELSQ